MTKDYFRDHYEGEWIGIASSRDEDVVPACISILRQLEGDNELSSGQQEELAMYDYKWSEFFWEDKGEWSSDDTEALIELVREALPPFADIDMSCEWADSGLRLYIPEDDDSDNVEEGS